MDKKRHINALAGYYIPVAVFALCGVALVYLSTRFYGAGISTDSVKYIAAARSLLAGQGVYSYDGTPLTSWPPLYPLELAVSGYLTGRDPAKLAALLNSLCFALTIFCAGIYFRRKLPCQPLIGLMGTGSVLFSIPLFYVSLWAWSESLFILLLVVTFIQVDRYLSKKNTFSLITLSICTSLALLTRYVGVTIVFMVGLVILFTYGSLKRKLRDIFLFGGISVFPLALWVLRNYLFVGFPFGNRWASSQSFSTIILTSAKIVMEWFIPISKTWIAVIFPITLVLFYFLLALNRKGSSANVKTWINWFWPVLIYAFTFPTFLILTSLVSQQGFNIRTLSPQSLPMIILITGGIAAVAFLLEKRFKPVAIQGALMAIYLGWLILIPAAHIRGEIKNMVINGGWLNSSASRDNDVVQYLVDNQLDKTCMIYTNFPDAVYYLAGMKSEKTLSRTRLDALESQAKISGKPASWPPEEKACLVWFNDTFRENYLEADELQKISNVRTLAELKYGVVYELTQKTGFQER